MIKKTQGIVLNYSKYKETSIIVRVLTRDYGYNSFIVNNIRSAKSKRSIGVFQPLNIVDLSFYHKPQSTDIHRLNEIKIEIPLIKIQTTITKTTLALFLSEILQKLFRHDQSELNTTFDFIKNSIWSLENISKGVENFHLQFLLKISPYIGFGIEDTSQLLIKNSTDNSYILTLITNDYGVNIPISGQHRFELLESILSYYNNHIQSFGEVKSLNVLHTIFHQ